MGVLRIINIDKTLYRQGFGKSNTARVKRGPDCQSLFYELLVQKIIKGRRMYLENVSKCFKYRFGKNLETIKDDLIIISDA